MSEKIKNGELKTAEWLNDWLEYDKEDQARDYQWHDTKQFADDFAVIAKNMKHINITGGEPTLIKSNVRMLENLAKVNNSDCNYTFTTNLTTWNEAIYSKLHVFKQCEVQVSIDGTGAINDYLRYGSKWNIIEKNFEKLLTLPSTVKITVFTVVQALNVNHIVDIIEWLSKYMSKRAMAWCPILLEHPVNLQISLVPMHIREEACLNLSKLASRLETSDDTKALAAAIHQVQKFILDNPPNRYENYFRFNCGEGKNYQMLLDYLELLDRQRGTDWTKLFPDIAESLFALKN